ncbi:hypothetical protein [Saccharothrix hoggarensis]|uniref:DUF3592 domain-containing protein n=1 Tax=Saccharothrix hoggarensis TaxID=913853 RepID=A0ABW3QZD0_9PSEU
MVRAVAFIAVGLLFVLVGLSGLGSDGLVDTEAEVVAVHQVSKTKRMATVEFTTVDGVPVTRHLPQSTRSPQPGDRVEVRYSLHDPEFIDYTDNQSGLIFIPVMGLGAVGVGVWLLVERRRRSR